MDNNRTVLGGKNIFLILFLFLTLQVGCSSKKKMAFDAPALMDVQEVEPVLDRPTIRAEIKLIDSEISNIDAQIADAQTRSGHIMPGFEGMKHAAQKEIRELKTQKSQLSTRRDFLKSQLYQNQ